MEAIPLIRTAGIGLLLLTLVSACAGPSSAQLTQSSEQISSTMKAMAFVLQGYSKGTVSSGYLRASIVQYGQELSQEEETLKSQKPPPAQRGRWRRTVLATSRANSLASSASSALPGRGKARVLAAQFAALARLVSVR